MLGRSADAGGPGPACLTLEALAWARRCCGVRAAAACRPAGARDGAAARTRRHRSGRVAPRRAVRAATGFAFENVEHKRDSNVTTQCHHHRREALRRSRGTSKWHAPTQVWILILRRPCPSACRHLFITAEQQQRSPTDEARLRPGRPGATVTVSRAEANHGRVGSVGQRPTLPSPVPNHLARPAAESDCIGRSGSPADPEPGP